MTRKLAHPARYRVTRVAGQVFTSSVGTKSTGLDPRRLARLRQGTYRLLGATLLYPQVPVLVLVSKTAQDLYKGSKWVSRLAFYLPWDSFLRCARRLTPSGAQSLQDAYVDVFGEGSAQRHVPICESGFTDQTAESTGQMIADIEKEYESAGVSASAVGVESPDHAAVEMEFMSLLSGREAEAWEAGDLTSATEAVSRQKRFLENHPGRWFPYLHRAVSALDRSEFYESAVGAARSLVSHDIDFLGTVVDSLGAGPREVQESRQ